MADLTADVKAIKDAVATLETDLSSLPPAPVNTSDPAWDAFKAALEAEGWVAPATNTQTPNPPAAGSSS
jgi:hypothetical protein